MPRFSNSYCPFLVHVTELDVVFSNGRSIENSQRTEEDIGLNRYVRLKAHLLLPRGEFLLRNLGHRWSSIPVFYRAWIMGSRFLITRFALTAVCG